MPLTQDSLDTANPYSIIVESLPSLKIPYPLFQNRLGPYMAALLVKEMRTNVCHERNYMDVDNITLNTTDTREARVRPLGVSRFDLTDTQFSILENLWIDASWTRNRMVGGNEGKSGETLGEYYINISDETYAPKFYQAEDDPERTFGSAASWYWDNELKHSLDSSLQNASLAYSSACKPYVLVHNLINYFLMLATPTLTGLVNQELKTQFGLDKYQFIWSLSFALFSKITETVASFLVDSAVR